MGQIKMEEIIDQVGKLDKMFDYIQAQTNDEKETGEIIADSVQEMEDV